MKRKYMVFIPLLFLVFSMGFAFDITSAAQEEQNNEIIIHAPLIEMINDGAEYRQALDHPIRVDFRVNDPTIVGNIRIDMLLSSGERVNVCPGECVQVDGTGEFHFLLQENPLFKDETADGVNPLYEGLMIYDETDESSAVKTGDYFVVDSFFDVFFDITVTDVDRYDADQKTMQIRGTVVDESIRAEDVQISALTRDGQRYGICQYGKCFASPGYISYDWDPQTTFPKMSDLEIDNILLGLLVEDSTHGSQVTGMYSEKASYGGGLDILTGTGGVDKMPTIWPWPPGCYNCTPPDIYQFAGPAPSFNVDSFFDIDYSIDFRYLDNNFGTNTAHPLVYGMLNNPDFSVAETSIDVITKSSERFALAVSSSPANDRVFLAELDPVQIFPGWTIDKLNSEIDRIEIYPTNDPPRVQSLNWNGQFQVDSFFDVEYRIDFSSPPLNNNSNPDDFVVDFRGFVSQVKEDTPLELFVQMLDGSRETICSPCNFPMGDPGILGVGSLEDSGFDQEILMFNLNWAPTMTFPEMSLSELNENIVGIGIGELQDPSNYYLEPVDSFFDVFFDIEIDTSEFTHPIEKATPLLAKVRASEIPDASVVIDALHAGKRMNICAEGCAKNGEIRFDFEPGVWFPGLNADQLNQELDGFLVYNKNNVSQSLRLADHFFVDSFFDVTYQVDISPNHPKFAANDLIPFRVRIADLNIDPKSLDITIAATIDGTEVSLCEDGACESSSGYLTRIRQRPDLLTSEWDELIDSALESLDPIIRVKGGEPYDEFAFKVREIADLTQFVPPPLIAVGWDIKAGVYQFSAREFSSAGQLDLFGYPVRSDSIITIPVPSPIQFYAAIGPSNGGQINFQGLIRDVESGQLSIDNLVINPFETEMVALSLTSVNVDGVDYPMAGSLLSHLFMPEVLYTLDGPQPLFKALESRDQLKTYFSYLDGVDESPDGLTFRSHNNDGLLRVQVGHGNVPGEIVVIYGTGDITDFGLSRGLFPETDLRVPMSALKPIRIEFKTAGVDKPGSLDDIKVTYTDFDKINIGIGELIGNDFSTTGKFAVEIPLPSPDEAPPGTPWSEFLKEHFAGGALLVEMIGGPSFKMNLGAIDFYTPSISFGGDGSDILSFKLFEPIEIKFDASEFGEIKVVLFDDETGLLAHELTHTVQQGGTSLKVTPGFIIPGTYHLGVGCALSSCGWTRTESFELVGDNVMKIAIPALDDSDKGVAYGSSVNVDWEVYDGFDGEALVDIHLVNADNPEERQMLAEKLDYLAGTVEIQLGDTITIYGENFGTYFLEISLHGVPEINGRTEPFAIETVSDPISESTEPTGDDPSLEIPGFELPVALLSVGLLMVMYSRKRKNY